MYSSQRVKLQQNTDAKDFPILCEACLGDNPYIRMQRESFGKACKICERPFHVYRWRPGGPQSRYKTTQLCPTCAKVKNVCQTCVLDLDYGLPVQVRDTCLDESERGPDLPQDPVNRGFALEKIERQLANDEGASMKLLEYGDIPSTNQSLNRFSRKGGPYYERNKTHVCSFWQRGECTRGPQCPYRHEDPYKDNSLAKQNIRDRFYGHNDPVAKKMINVKEKQDREKDELREKQLEEQEKEEPVAKRVRRSSRRPPPGLKAPDNPPGLIKPEKIASPPGMAFISYPSSDPQKIA